MEKLKIVFVIPAKNEQKNIAKVILNLKRYSKVLVIDDNCNDGTNLIAESAGAKVIKVSKNKTGYQNAVYKGLKYSKKKNYDFAITCDADSQHKLLDILKIYKKCEKDKDIIYTTRKNINRNIEKIYNFFFFLLFNIRDPLSGLKAYNLKKIKTDFFSTQLETLTGSILIWFNLKSRRSWK